MNGEKVTRRDIASQLLARQLVTDEAVKRVEVEKLLARHLKPRAYPVRPQLVTEARKRVVAYLLTKSPEDQKNLIMSRSFEALTEDAVLSAIEPKTTVEALVARIGDFATLSTRYHDLMLLYARVVPILLRQREAEAETETEDTKRWRENWHKAHPRTLEWNPRLQYLLTVLDPAARPVTLDTWTRSA